MGKISLWTVLKIAIVSLFGVLVVVLALYGFDEYRNGIAYNAYKQTFINNPKPEIKTAIADKTKEDYKKEFAQKDCPEYKPAVFKKNGYTIKIYNGYKESTGASDECVDLLNEFAEGIWPASEKIYITDKNGDALPNLSKMYDGSYIAPILNTKSDYKTSNPQKFFTDINKNGIPELSFLSYSGGAHCCYETNIIELSNPVNIIFSKDLGDNAPTFKDIDGDGFLEMMAYEQGLHSYWPRSHGESPMPRIIFKLKDGNYQIDTNLMKKPPLSDKEFNALVQQTKNNWDNPNLQDPELLPWYIATDMVFAGNKDQAVKYIEAVWNPADAVRINEDFTSPENYWKSFYKQFLRLSQFTKELSEFIGAR